MSEFITLVEAVQMTLEYRTKREIIVASPEDVDKIPICETFEKDHVQTLLNNPDCTGIRAYFSMDSDENVKLILVAVNEADEDLYLGTDALLDRAIRCPDMCPPSSPLNT